MTTKLNFRSVVFKRAYLIVKETGVSFSAALKQAWERYRQYKAKVAKEIADRINGFDFYYYMSDDSRVYQKYWNNKVLEQFGSSFYRNGPVKYHFLQ